ncbi:hypothetical protein ACI79C_03350 [Geodermatophilus sp. SYSU D00697]
MKRPSTRWISGAVIATALAGGIVAAPAAAEAAVNYFDVTATVTGNGSATCPSGAKVTGGGFKVPTDYFGTLSSREYKVTSSYPSGSSWRATATVVYGNYFSNSGWQFRSSSYTPSVYAICVK